MQKIAITKIWSNPYIRAGSPSPDLRTFGFHIYGEAKIFIDGKEIGITSLAICWY